MQTYIINKIVSLAAVFLCIFLTLAYYGYGTDQWQAILLAIIVFGYGHFFLGFFYQLKSFLRKPKPWQHFLTFGVLTLFSIAFVQMIVGYFSLAIALFVGFIYFLFHGLFNEQTLILRQTGITVPLSFLYAFLVFVLGVILYSVPDQTFFFDRYLEFTTMSNGQAQFFFQNNYMSLTNLAIVLWGSLLLSLSTLWYAWYRYGFPRLTLFLAFVIIGGMFLIVTNGPPAYIYAYVFVVGYHFMTWMLFYIVEMKKRGTKIFRNFIFHNILILVPLIYVATLFSLPYPPDIAYVLFDYKYFAIMTYIHITTSFMNDSWLQMLQTKTFAWFGSRP